MTTNNSADYYQLHENDDDGCLAVLCNNRGCLVACIKHTNNKSLPGICNNVKHNEVSNDNNNKGSLVKYGYIDASGTRHMTKANIDNSTEANSHNEQKTIKIRTNNHNNEWWFSFENNDIIDPIIKHNNMNNTPITLIITLHKTMMVVLLEILILLIFLKILFSCVIHICILVTPIATITGLLTMMILSSNVVTLFIITTLVLVLCITMEVV